MWQIDTRLPPFSNREDYLLTLAAFDDDTLLPIDLSGITLANTGTPFTASSWTVVAGGIVTSSSTSITIPTFPIINSNNLTALSLTVGASLAISPGFPVQMKDTATGLNSLIGYVVSYASGTGVLTVQIGWLFQFEIRRGGARNVGDGYQTWWDWGVPDDLGPLLQANFANGYLSLISNNVVQILIPASIISTLGSTSMFGTDNQPGTFKAAMIGSDSVNTRQFLIGSQPFYFGGVLTMIPGTQQSQANWQAIF
jgi:hypothetical protein